MFPWLTANLANIIVVALLVFIVGLVIRGMIRERKAGKSSCGCNCTSCAGCAGSCGGAQLQSSGLDRMKKSGREHASAEQ